MVFFTLSITHVGLAFTLLVVYIIARTTSWKHSSLPLPPGPRRIPLIGNLLDMPSKKEWETFAKWEEKYGATCLILVFGQTMIILNSTEHAVELLDKRSAIYSDRPIVPMGGELVGWNRAIGLLPYGKRFKKYRRLAKQLFGSPKTMEAFHPVEEEEAHRLLKRVVSNPEEFANHIQKMAGATILRVTHGYRVQEGEDPFVKLADKAMLQFAASTSSTGFMVNMIPARVSFQLTLLCSVPTVKYVPEWVPGAGFHKIAKEWATNLEETVELPFEWVKAQMANGTAEMSFLSSMLSQQPTSKEEEYDVKWTASSLYTGETFYILPTNDSRTGVAQVSFFKAMLLWPDVVKKAQAEIDRVIGNDRLPTFADRPNLPYLNALALETFRWHCAGPTGIPHRLMADNIYNGYFIPKGRQMTHNPSTYPDPWVFKPERFLTIDGQEPQMDPRDLCFGFGRRICPGRVLADASVFISCAMILAVFDISPYVENGVPDAPPDIEQEPGLVSHPSKFRCSITPRSNKALSLIMGDES
ncbi:cytochrome P450 [Dendrothele bispora CBS 962.96]|uniref:Cytochrome P450 n=1 Tax=Dendrothele bispora (strain CBS 962.96) TaxID=1314807 RepID=A0A4S8L673_DENBC|nr:cytochrome P450 [Dendrothele bispora CBS 962.96]